MKKKTKITELNEATVLEGLWVLGVNASNHGVKAAISLLRGLDGKEVEMCVTSTAVQYRLTGGTWKDLLSIAVLQKPATDAAKRLNALSDHRDEIRNGYWWRWDEVTDTWRNTGEIAKGNVMYATFDVDLSTMELSMLAGDEYTGANFELDEKGYLSVIIQ